MTALASEKDDTNNKGIIFERDFSKEIQKYLDGEKPSNPTYRKALQEILSTVEKSKTYRLVGYSWDGGKNQRRPLHVESSKIYTGTKNGSGWDIGSTVTDITLNLADDNGKTKNVYLSLKYGPTVAFVNAGITKILNESEMTKGDIRNAQGRLLLEMLSIDSKKFCSIFNLYKEGIELSKKDVVDITSKLKGNAIFKGFLESAIGYGYVLVHNVSNKVHVQNMTKETMSKLISNVKKAYIEYPKDGSAKRIDIIIQMNGIDLKVNIRNKRGKIYPTHIMVDYKLKY